MGRVFKVLIYIIILAAIGLTGYAYLGPFFGVDFSATQQETRIPVTLSAD